MPGYKRAIEFLALFVLFPIAVFVVVGVVIAISVAGFIAYVGGLLAAWLLVAYVFPLAMGIMTLDEIGAAIRFRRKRSLDGEALPGERRALWRPKPPQSDAPLPPARLPVYQSSRTGWADW